jgi:hypothetical protein
MKKAKSAKKSTAKRITKKAGNPAATKKAGAKSKRPVYLISLKKKVVQAVKKGMSHVEASKVFKVGVYSIPAWIKAHS